MLSIPVKLITLYLGMFAFVGTMSAGQQEKIIFQDSFDGKPGEGWQWEREEPSQWRVNKGGLEVLVRPGNMWGSANNAKNVMVHPIPCSTNIPVEISVVFSNSPTAQWEQANLVWFYNDSNMVKLGQELVTGRLSIVMGREENDRARTIAIIPLDDNSVELRLQSANRLLRGQFRTRHWKEWRDVGICDLPVNGDPKASLQFYNGPAKEEHWIKINQFTIKELSTEAIDWPRKSSSEQICRFPDETGKNEFLFMPIKHSKWSLASNIQSLSGTQKGNCTQKLCQYQDGSIGWSWDRRSTGNVKPTSAGIGMGYFDPQCLTNSFPFPITTKTSIAMEINAVTGLDNDGGSHNLSVQLFLNEKKNTKGLTHKISIWFDWYGNPATQFSFSDGFRNYEYLKTIQTQNEPVTYVYRIQGFRGSPPRINLQAFLADAIKQGCPDDLILQGIWFGNEIWDGSRGSTLITHCNLMIDGKPNRLVEDALPKGN